VKPGTRPEGVGLSAPEAARRKARRPPNSHSEKVSKPHITLKEPDSYKDKNLGDVEN